MGRVCISIPTLHTNLSSLVEPDQPIDSPVVDVINESHKEPSEFLFSQLLISISASVSDNLF